MNVASLVMAGALCGGVACRGGLEIGIAAKYQRVGIYGPALYKAYRLESEVAQYPRIVIGKDLVDHLNESLKDSQDTKEARVRRIMAEKCLALIFEDTDGAFALDYAHQSIRDADPNCRTLLEGAYKFAIEEWNKFTKERNHKLAARYFLLVNYLDTRREISKDI